MVVSDVCAWFGRFTHVFVAVEFVCDLYILRSSQRLLTPVKWKDNKNIASKKKHTHIFPIIIFRFMFIELKRIQHIIF